MGDLTVSIVTEVHWEFGRTLIDLTIPQPSEDRTARLWYVTTAAFLANRSLLADQASHLRSGEAIFPSDPDLLFANGCYYETLASPRIRPVIDSTVMPTGVTVLRRRRPTRAGDWPRTSSGAHLTPDRTSLPRASGEDARSTGSTATSTRFASFGPAPRTPRIRPCSITPRSSKAPRRNRSAT